MENNMQEGAGYADKEAEPVGGSAFIWIKRAAFIWRGLVYLNRKAGYLGLQPYHFLCVGLRLSAQLEQLEVLHVKLSAGLKRLVQKINALREPHAGHTHYRGAGHCGVFIAIVCFGRLPRYPYLVRLAARRGRHSGGAKHADTQDYRNYYGSPDPFFSPPCHLAGITAFAGCGLWLRRLSYVHDCLLLGKL